MSSVILWGTLRAPHASIQPVNPSPLLNVIGTGCFETIVGFNGEKKKGKIIKKKKKKLKTMLKTVILGSTIERVNLIR